MKKIKIVDDMVNSHTLTYVRPEFVLLMEEILAYGHRKHASESFQSAVLTQDFQRRGDRLSSNTILHHIHAHALDYEQRIPHDHFSDLAHQLAAIAVNAMMECYFLIGEERAKLEEVGESRSPETEE